MLALGSTEQHGRHLPAETDTRIATALAERFCAEVTDAVALPVLPIGCAREHRGFPATLSLDEATLVRVLRDVAASAGDAGFEELVVCTAHGGNYGALRALAADPVLAAKPIRLVVLSEGAEFARRFWEASFRQWGRTMQDDISDSVAWAIEEGICTTPELLPQLVAALEEEVMRKSGYKSIYHELEFFGQCPDCHA